MRTVVFILCLFCGVRASASLPSDVAAWPSSIFVAGAGDSIMEGYTNYLTTLDGGPTGTPLGDVMQRLYYNSGNYIRGTNFGKSGAAMAFTQNVVDNFAIPTHPKYLVVHVGINDINGGTTWTNTFFDHMLAKCKSSNCVMMVDEVWPWKTSLTNQIAAWNTSLANWVATNTTYPGGLHLLRSHDLMANPTNNALIWTPYTWDTQHPTLAGTDEFAQIILAKIYELSGNIRLAASAEYSDVQTAVSAAADGDVIQIPAGTASWSNTISTARSIYVRGQSTNDTIIINNITNTSPAQGVFFYFTSNGGVCQVSDIQFQQGTAPSSQLGHVTYFATVKWDRTWRCYFNEFRNVCIRPSPIRGLVDTCYFTWVIGHNGIITPHTAGSFWGTYGDLSWATLPYFGSVNALYIENCMFNGTGSASFLAATDAYAGARFVCRSNIFINCYVDNHGSQSTGRPRSVREAEIYSNQFTNLAGLSRQVVDMRGGTFLIYSNHISGANWTSLGTASDYRENQTEPYDGAHPELGGWGGADGTNQFDVIVNGIFETGTHTAASGALTLSDSTKSWTPSQWIGYTVINKNLKSIEQTNENRFAAITANGPTTIDYIGSNREVPLKITWQNGDAYEIRKVDFTLDHIGAGRGDLLTGAFPAPRDLHQTFEPVYSWNNERGGSTNSLLIVTSYPASEIEGRDFFNNTILPGYTPLVYPYPLPLGPDVAITPTTISMSQSQSVDFDVSGGSGTGYRFELVTDTSGGTLDSITGFYTAGPTNGTAQVRAFDSYGFFADASITILPGPSITFSASPNPVVAGSSTTLSWTSSGAANATLDGNAVALNGSTNITPTIPAIHNFSASNTNGTSSIDLTVGVIPTATFTASPATITFGNQSTLVWHTAGATNITLDGIAVAANGTNNVSPASTTTYSLMTSNTGNSTNSLQTVTVTTLPPRNFILRAARELLP